MTNVIKKAMEVGFDKRVKPTGFLSNLFEKKQLKTIKVEIQGRSVKAIYSVDTKLGTGGRRVDLSGYDKKDFIIPEYNNFAVLTEKDVFNAQFGENEYQIQSNIATTINDSQEIISDMHRFAEEKQASDALFQGKIVLVDNSEIEYNKKATHTISKSSAKWNSTDGKPIDDIKAACALCIKDGKLSTSEFNLIMEDAGLSALLNNTQFKNNSNWNEGIKRSDINMPIENDQGAMFHGQFSCGSYRINLWSYNAFYEVPKGYNFANEGQIFTFIPKGCAAILPVKPTFKKYYAAINNVNASSLLGGSKMQLVEKEQLPYAYDEVIDGSVVTKAGVKSRPLYVPVDVDCFATFKDLV